MNMHEPGQYVGRFAPSPTGPLHFGSLVAATASYLEARTRNGHWLIRIEDIDPPREQEGATDQILTALDAYGFEWDGDVAFQSKSRDAHLHAIQTLIDAGQAYRCDCSRRDLADFPHGSLGVIYPGTCRDRSVSGEAAVRVQTAAINIAFEDRLQGRVVQDIERDSGDFIIHRRDGLIAYQLAVVVDDHLQKITDVVRGIDLIDSTARQLWLQRLLGYEHPGYAHIPVVTHPDGDKLSKLTGAPGLTLESTVAVLVEALVSLQQTPPPDLASETLAAVWDWALENWRPGKLKGVRAVVKTP